MNVIAKIVKPNILKFLLLATDAFFMLKNFIIWQIFK